jgi:hypothetical protein
LVSSIKADIVKGINQNIQLGVFGGLAPGEIISNLTNFIPTEGTRWAKMENGLLLRAETIVRTEMNRILNQSNQMRAEQYKEEGVEVVKVWQHSGAENPHPGHPEMNGQERPIDEPFDNPVTGNQLMYPNDPAAPASETVNCGCYMLTTSKRFSDLFNF